jgi:response regulator NasT
MGKDVLGHISRMDGGIIISGLKLKDMHYSALSEQLPEGFFMLLTASQKWEEFITQDNVSFYPLPIRVMEYTDEIENLIDRYRQWKKKRKKGKTRTPEERAIIDRAKDLLIEIDSMSELQAHKYIQKTSMESGTNVIEVCEMIITLKGGALDGK